MIGWPAPPLGHCHLLLIVLLAVALVGFIVWNVSAAHHAALHNDGMPLAVIHIGLEFQGLAFKQIEQQAFGDGVVAVVLLQNLQTAATRVAQHHRIRLHMGGNVAEKDVVHARHQVERHVLPHHGKKLVVNGE
jgi:hypothetical protein